ncbi:MAG: phytanoyl-CoA dioxygenase family protein [Alphaproteobacteria bacterium]|nr:phytanoyl-CoA dioxygenase family protein [Alphaproteobacteria bacterium]
MRRWHSRSFAVLSSRKNSISNARGAGFTPHQDQQAGWWNYASRFVSIMVSIDLSTEENGCVELAAGHHRDGMFREWEPLSEDDMKTMTFVPVETRPGDVVLIDSFVRTALPSIARKSSAGSISRPIIAHPRATTWMPIMPINMQPTRPMWSGTRPATIHSASEARFLRTLTRRPVVAPSFRRRP